METFIFLGFNFHAWITIVTVLGMFTILLFTKWRSDIVFLGAIGVLYVTGVLDAKAAFSGFGNTSVVTVGVLFVVVAGLMHTPCRQYLHRQHRLPVNPVAITDKELGPSFAYYWTHYFQNMQKVFQNMQNLTLKSVWACGVVEICVTLWPDPRLK